MAIRNLSQVSCSLNLGLIYSLSYGWSPQSGATISVFFVNQQGVYNRPQYMQKAQITIGSASFSMYVVASDIQLASGRRVIEVSFVDETFQLENYYVTLTGKGCGQNVYQLGTPVDNRTSAQKQASSLDATAQQIAEFTSFQDIEYSFDSFLTILRQRFNVSIGAFYDKNITSSFTGTFRDVLDAWCQLFNLSWFIENGILKIFDPTTLNIQLPTQPTEAITYQSSEDVRDTYGKTICNWFQQDGGQFSLNQTSDSKGKVLVRTETLYPVNNIFNNPQPSIDLNQVAAAQYGEQFWFLYNYVKGTTSEECGWTPITPQASNSNQVSTLQSVQTLGGRLVLQDNDVYQGRFDAYYQYGQKLAGRWYMSLEKSELEVDKTYTWFDESQGQITTFTDQDDKTMNLTFVTPVGSATQKIPETVINQYYPGVNYFGNRIIYQDNTPISGSFNINSAQVGQVYDSIFKIPNSDSFDFSSFSSLAKGQNVLAAYNTNVTLPENIISLINDIPSKVSVFSPRFTSIPIKGIRTIDYSSLKSSQTEQAGVKLVVGTNGGNVVSNTAVIKTLEQGSYNVYYNKYSKCASASSLSANYFKHRFDLRQISSDNQIGISFAKTAENTYKINRDYSVINALVNNPLLPQMARARSFLTKRVSFSVNYFYAVPFSFLTNGLVGMSLSVGDNGISASYSFSNEVLEVPNYENDFAQFEQQIRNSWIRQYTPNTVIK